MNDTLLLRYSRQIMLPEIDMEGQERLAASRVLIVGLGGLGSPAALYLAAAGVGMLVLLDHDQVDLSNLQRQIAHDTDSIGQHKTTSAERRLRAINPEVRIHSMPERATPALLRKLAAEVDVVLDGTDNFATRFMVNRACLETGRALVSGAAIRMEGQLAVFRPGQAASPCYACLYPEDIDERRETCSETGVLAPVVGVIGSLMATEAMRLLTGFGTPATGRLTLWDARLGEWRQLSLPRDPDCRVCGTQCRVAPP
jgi:molybdopterin-synthase adenylyltransferase